MKNNLSNDLHDYVPKQWRCQLKDLRNPGDSCVAVWFEVRWKAVARWAKRFAGNPAKVF